MTSKKKTVEDVYQKVTQLEHILLRPDTYVGSADKVTQMQWVFDETDQKMVQRELTYVPGLYKIFDEILVNAADNKVRDESMTTIKIDIDSKNNLITVFNDGAGIPVVEHKKEKIIVPSLIFGHLLTSSNYDDADYKITGGRNGYGAKLCNIFSTKFTVETSCKEYGKQFSQTWRNNMTVAEEPKIWSAEKKDFTRVQFSPDLSKFKQEELDEDIVALFSRRAYDIAATTKGVKVTLNGRLLKVNNFRDYVELYTKDKTDDLDQPLSIIYEQVNSRWELAVVASDTNFRQVSFVNNIATHRGGRHVDYIAEQFTQKLLECAKKKHKDANLKPSHVKNHLWLFINCRIVNPSFDSQTKDYMELVPRSFGSTCVLGDKFFAQVVKSPIMDNILSWVKAKQHQQLSSKIKGTKTVKVKGIPKLDDANEAGTKNSYKCTLILTEGDSAKALAMAGLGVIGRDHYGVFPLRGKLLNVRDASHKQIMANQEIVNLTKIVGLQFKETYIEPVKLQSLRYGKIMIMADQDQDGSHIKGLVINAIHFFWPQLIKKDFIEEFITPIIKVSKGRQEKSFFTIPEFESWKASCADWHTWRMKYYKGLGTSTSKEAKEYFSNMDRHKIALEYSNVDDDNAIDLAFCKKRVEDRKSWLTSWMEECRSREEMGLPEQYLYQPDTKKITYNQFINKELILFSNTDNVRSIPSLVDGFKPGQRKVMFTCIKRNIHKEIKVAQLAGSVGELSSYHHGEQSLMSTIVNLAHNFVGSNNLNLLLPVGQFGTRLHGGKDAASARYIFTCLSPLTRHLFNKQDDNILNYIYDDGQYIEPTYYVPIIPMVLVNGADGIGTGWSTHIPNYDIRAIVGNIRRLIRGEELVSMTPSYKNFRGSIEQVSREKYVVSGEVGVIDDRTIEITELPIKTWTQPYKEDELEPLVNGGEKVTPIISDYKEYNTDSTVRFVIKLKDDVSKFEEKGLHSVFKLQSTISTSSMVLFDSGGVLKKYKSAEEIMHEFFVVRLRYYKLRKEYMEGILGAETLRLRNQARFISERLGGKIAIENKSRKDIVQLLVSKKYDPDPVKAWNDKNGKNRKTNVDVDELEEKTETGGDYNYIMKMPLWCYSKDDHDDLMRRRDLKIAELEDLRKKTPSDLWNIDLDAFEVELDKVEKAEIEDAKPPEGGQSGPKGKKRGKGNPASQNSLPSSMATRVIPAIQTYVKKYMAQTLTQEKRDQKKKDKLSGEIVTKSQKRQKSSAKNDDLPLAKRLGSAAAGMKSSNVDIRAFMKSAVNKIESDEDSGPPPRKLLPSRSAKIVPDVVDLTSDGEQCSLNIVSRKKHVISSDEDTSLDVQSSSE